MKARRGKKRSGSGHRHFWRLLLVIAVPAAIFLFVEIGCTTSAIRPPRGAASNYRTVTMTVTGYCNCGKCCSWQRNWYGKPIISAGARKGQPKQVGVTASGTHARVGTVAADTTRYPFGTIVYVPGYGYGRVEDRGGAIKGERLDLWFATHGRATKWGKQRLPVKVWLPR